MTYDEFITSILNNRGRFECGEDYHERHHILHKCMGGTDEDYNLIDLFAREHFEAHRLLALENPDNHKLSYALWCMCSLSGSSKRRENVTAEEYEEARIYFSHAMSQRMRGENNPMYGKSLIGFCHSQKTKEKISVAAKRRFKNSNERELYSALAKERFQNPKNTPMFGKHHSEESKHKMSISAKERLKNPEDNPMYGRPWWNEDTPQDKIETWKQRLSESMSGENNPNFGKHPSNETIKKRVASFKATMSTDTMKKKLSENNSKENNPNARKINQYNKDGRFICAWACIAYASETLNICAQNISRAAKSGGRRSAGGFIWYYTDDPTQPDKTKIITQQNDCKEVELQ